MANLAFLVSLFLSIVSLSRAISFCQGPCQTFDDCDGNLICINSQCNDDPNVGTDICSNDGRGRSGGTGGRAEFPSSSSDGCEALGSLNCEGESFPQFHCSPRVTSSTQAILTNNDFSEGGDGGDGSKCDGKFHDNSKRVVALSTGWYNGGSRCGKKIRITARNGRSVLAKVVDECDSVNGCDKAHAHQPPCRNNIVDGSNGVWHALGLPISAGVEPVVWSDA